MSEQPIVSRQDGEQAITSALGDHAAELNVPAIADTLWDPYDGWTALEDTEAFWAAVRRHQR